MLKEDILKISKYVYFKSYDNPHPAEFIDENDLANTLDYLDKRTYLSIGTSDPNSRYSGVNKHHYTTKYLYSQFNLLCNYLNINYNEDDFILIDNKINNEDFSYLKPKYQYKFKVTATELAIKYYDGKRLGEYYPNSYVEEGTYDMLISKPSVYNGEFLGNVGYPVESPYHKLFSFSHQPVTIENLSIRNNRKIFINCDSHMVPYIPLLCCYFEKVVIMDNRLIDTHLTYLYDNENFTDALIALSLHTNTIKNALEVNF